MFTEKLRSRFSLSIVVLTGVMLLCTNTLLAGRLAPITSLMISLATHHDEEMMTDHLPFSGQGAFKHGQRVLMNDEVEKIPATQTCFPPLQSWRGRGGLITGHYGNGY